MKRSRADGRANARSLPDRWKYSEEELRQSPSQRDGINNTKEQAFRLAAHAICVEQGSDIFGESVLTPAIVHSAIVFFQRFYTRQSMREYQYKDMAFACLLLAGKVEWGRVEDTGVAIGSVIWRYLRSVKKVPPEELRENNELWVTTKERLVKYERVLLYTLEFEVNLKSPHRSLDKRVEEEEKAAAEAEAARLEAEQEADAEAKHTVAADTKPTAQHTAKSADVIQRAKRLVDDSYKTQLPVRFSANEIACGCLFLASHLMLYPLHAALSVPSETLFDVCIPLLKLTPETTAAFESRVGKIRQSLGLPNSPPAKRVATGGAEGEGGGGSSAGAGAGAGAGVGVGVGTAGVFTASAPVPPTPSTTDAPTSSDPTVHSVPPSAPPTAAVPPADPTPVAPPTAPVTAIAPAPTPSAPPSTAPSSTAVVPPRDSSDSVAPSSSDTPTALPPLKEPTASAPEPAPDIQPPQNAALESARLAS